MTDVFVSTDRANLALSEFVLDAGEALGLANVEERESSNYAEGLYFLATLGPREVEISYLDTQGIDDYVFLISIESALPEEIQFVASTLALGMYRCFVPQGAWYRKDWDGQGVAYGGEFNHQVRQSSAAE